MGYNVTMECDVTIHEPNFPQVIEAARRLVTDLMEHPHFDARDMIEALDAGDLITFLDTWGYQASLSKADDGTARITLDWFEGEKLRLDEKLWFALGSFIEKGGSIQCQGEDGALWRWYFTGTECVEQAGTIVYS